MDGVVGGTPLRFGADLTPEEWPSASIREYLAQNLALLSEGERRPIVYGRERITSDNRKRLIQSWGQFLVPGSLMYLPELGLPSGPRAVGRSGKRPKQFSSTRCFAPAKGGSCR